MAYLGILDVVLILLIMRTDTGHRNSEIYQAMQIRVLHTPWAKNHFLQWTKAK